ncbi:IS66 family insertion sequence element accessory protein TnpB [Granulosicoccus sp.]|nr:IS66 family insertion sequence element accessory protein TnpB [Granulosicoccus sp.]MDB4224163.1 IS66 family insertion sequence element accessory protein TnpB [Granulosicoccus sp.]
MQRYKRLKAKQWQSLVEDQAQSGLSATEFCKEYQIGYASFCAWRKRLSQPTTNSAVEPTFVELTPPDLPSIAQPWAVELQVGENLVLRIAKG